VPELAGLHLAVFGCYLFLIYVVLERNHHALLNRMCAGVLACSAIWALAYGMVHRSPTPELALFWINISAIGWCSMPPGILWFFLVFSNRQDLVKGFARQALIGLPALFFLVMQWSGQLITEVQSSHFGWVGFWPNSVISYLFFAYYGITIALAIWLNILALREARTNRIRLQARLIHYTFPITILLGLTTDIILPEFRVMLVPQMADVALLFWGFGLFLAITRYGLMGLTPIAAYEDILRTMTDSLVLLNPNGRIEFANQAAAAVTGNSPASLVGRPFAELTSNPASTRALLERVWGEGREFRGEMDFRGADKRELPVLVSITTLRDRGQEMMGLLVLARDITAQKQAEAELLTYRDLIDAILNALPEAVLLLGPEHEVELANNTACQLLELPRRECAGQPLESRLPEPALSRAVSAAGAGNTPPATVEFRYGPSGRELVIQAQVIPMGKGRTLAILRDITRDRERESQLYLADRLSSVGQMAAGVAHELNNPLTSVIGLAETLQVENLSPEAREDVNTISREAKRAAQVIRNLLTFARHHPVTREPVQLNRVIEEVLRLRGYEQKVRNIEVVTSLDPDLPEVPGDHFQLQQVILNIVLNAEHALTEGRPGGRLVITSWCQNDLIRVSLADDGPGIRTEDLPRIFNPFFTTKEVGKGTGLGLSICYGIITSHGGRIWVDSLPGQGATFNIELPVSPTPA
jgi:PAS domain S-box-containing protein